jgi:hypothetical protein
MGEEGLEPPTSYLEGSCSIRLSYSPRRNLYFSLEMPIRQRLELNLLIMGVDKLEGQGNRCGKSLDLSLL